MKHQLLALLFCLPVLFLFAIPAYAQSPYFSGKDITLPKTQVITNDYFAAGSTITIDGTINGDAYVAGGNIIVDGTINGDLLAAGGNVIVRGTVAHNIRMVGGQLVVEGNIGGNTSIAGGSTIIAKTAQLTGNVVVAAGNTTISAPVPKDLTIAGGNITIDTTVNGNLTMADGTATLTPAAKVAGNVTYLSQNSLQVQNGNQIAGTVTHKIPPQKAQETTRETPNPAAFFGALTGIALLVKIISFVSSLIIGFLIITFLPNYSQKAAQLLTQKPWMSLGVGFITIILAPFLIIALFVSIVGIPLAIGVIASVLLVALIAKVSVLIVIGQKSVAFFHRQSSLMLAYTVGLLLYEVITIIPIVGGLISLVVTMLGIGVILIQEKYYYTALRAGQEI